MKIVFMEADTYGDDIDFTPFYELGEVCIYNKSDDEANPDRIQDADVVVVNKIPMSEKTLYKANKLKLIAVAATGTNNVDYEYVGKRGIVVTNVSGYSTMSVAQHTFAMLLYLYEKLDYYNNYVKSGEYSKSDLFTHMGMKFHELAGKTWGILGMGAIGRSVAEIAKTFGCEVIYCSSTGNNKDQGYRCVDFDTLLSESDIISVHAPLHEGTEGIFDYDAFCKMKKTAFFINVARGPIVVQKDLVRALEEGEIEAAGIDVLCEEPCSSDDPVMKIKDSNRLLVTPHMAWATVEARKRCLDEVYENIKAWSEGRERNVVGGTK